MSRLCVITLCEVDAPLADGFVNRNQLIIRALRQNHDVTVIGLAPDERSVLPGVDLPLVEPAGFDRRSPRSDRLVRVLRLMLGRLGLDPLERRLRATVKALEPDVVLSLTYRRVEVVRAVRDLAPTVLFAEEPASPAPSPVGSRLGRMIGSSLDQLRRRAASGLPLVTVIGPAEVAWAEQRFASPVVVAPQGIDTGYWASEGPHDATSGPFDVVTIGNFQLERNVEGLVAILDALTERGWPEGLRIRAVSATGHHPSLKERESPQVVLDGPMEDPRPLYRSAVATVVPAFEAIGVKNGIIQGWGSRCVVVTTPASAATTGGIDGEDLLIGESPMAIAELIAGLPRDDRLEAIRAAGRAHLEQRFAEVVHDGALNEIVERLAGRSG